MVTISRDTTSEGVKDLKETSSRGPGNDVDASTPSLGRYDMVKLLRADGGCLGAQRR